MPVTQQLSSGINIEQDLNNAVRFVFFDTGMDEWRYATYAGVLFLVQYNSKIYGVTARHVFQNFNWRQLVVTKGKFGNQNELVAELRYFYYPTALEGAAEGSDIGDIAIIDFTENCQHEFFLQTPYLIDAGTIAFSQSDDHLLIHGSLQTQSSTNEAGVVHPQYCTFTDLVDSGISDQNPTLRKATITFSQDITFDNITGISGGPVFNITQNKLCGMVVRGGLTNFNATIWYLDIGDIVAFIRSIDQNVEHTRYQRTAFR